MHFTGCAGSEGPDNQDVKNKAWQPSQRGKRRNQEKLSLYLQLIRIWGRWVGVDVHQPAQNIYCHHQHHFISPVRPCPFVFPHLLVGFLHSKFHSEHHHTPQPCDRLWLKQQKSVCTALPIRNVFEGSQICRKKAVVKVIFPFWISFKPIFDLNVIKAIFQDTIWLPTKKYI